MSFRKFLAPLASGGDAVVLRLDADAAEVLPLFLTPAAAVVQQLARRRAEARFGLDFAARGIGVSGLHLLRLEAGNLQEREMVVNGGYFLFEIKEIGPYDRCGDPIGLVAEGGEVFSPPLFGRAALVGNGSGWRIRRLSSDDCRVILSEIDGEAEVFFADSHPVAPPPSGPAVDAIVQGRIVVAHRPASTVAPPVSGCIIRVPEEQVPAVGTTIRYVLNSPLQAGIQAGPSLVEGGVLAPQTQASFAIERLDGVSPPFGWPANWRETRAARLAAGIDARGELFFCAVEGGSSVSTASDKSGTGATLADMATLMLDQGAHDAINLDGGGSVQVFGAAGGSFLQSGEFFQPAAFAGGSYERPVPTALKLRLK